jgi:hypothetical protein
MSTMSTIRYRSLCRYAGEWLDAPKPKAIPIDEVATISARSGVYIVCEPLEQVQYVGSVCRPNSIHGVADRLREHLLEPAKRLCWKSVWVIPILPEAPLDAVRGIEACIGTDLLPLGQGRLPRLL